MINHTDLLYELLTEFTIAGITIATLPTPINYKIAWEIVFDKADEIVDRLIEDEGLPTDIDEIMLEIEGRENAPKE